MRLFADGVMPMNEGLLRGREVFSLCCILGIALGAVYDLLRALRRGLRTGRALENISDFFFALLFFFCWYAVSVAQVGGVRLFTLAALLIGLLAERYTSGRLIVCVFGRIFGIIGGIGRKILGKIKQKAGRAFVKTALKFQKQKKIGKNT